MTQAEIRALTIERLSSIPGLTVWDTRTTASEVSHLPAAIVYTPRARMTSDTMPAVIWEREQTLTIECQFVPTSDADLGNQADLVEEAVYAALIGSEEWRSAWEDLRSWTCETGRSAAGNVRIGVVEITIVGAYQVTAPDPDGMVDLSELRITLGSDGTVQTDDPSMHLDMTA